MATFTVNGRTVTVEKNQKLLRYLRDTLGLTSVKDGCSEGACGPDLRPEGRSGGGLGAAAVGLKIE